MQNDDNNRHLLHLPHDFYFRLKVFGRGRTSYYAFIVPLNSPLKLIFKHALLQLSESGGLDYISTVWEGKEIGSSSGGGGSELVVLSIGQVLLVFILFSFILVSTFLVLSCELMYKHIIKKP